MLGRKIPVYNGTTVIGHVHNGAFKQAAALLKSKSVKMEFRPIGNGKRDLCYVSA